MPDQPAFDPPVGIAEEIGPNLRRILAPNPSPMTFRGTNTFLIGQTDVAVIDPGPDSIDHLEAILAALRTGQRITHILVTHAHLDHSPLTAALQQATGAPVYAFGPADAGRSDVMQALAASGAVAGGEGVDHGFVPDETLDDGEILSGPDWQLQALWTPGHFGNHLSFAMDDTVFCGDLVMGWASSLVSPPDGDLTDFMMSCRRVRDLNAKQLMPGHGGPIDDPAARISWLLDHRKARETAIVAALRNGPATSAEITERVYTDTPRQLMPAATRNVLAHLIDLYVKNRVCAEDTLSAETIFYLS